MEWRIRESYYGGYVVEKGMQHNGDVAVGFNPGTTMRAFIVYEFTHCDTLKDAERYIREHAE